jgi:hypothetical protein
MTEQKACVIFNKLVVNNIEDSSGIFIGTNQAIGWSSCSKSNFGFGSATDATLSHMISVVQDQDVIDAKVEELRNISLSEWGNPLQQCAIDFETIQANSVNNGSAIDLGDIKQLGWRSSRKVNYGTGKNLGGNLIRQVAAITADQDLIDAPFHMEGQINDVSGAVKNIRIVQNPPEIGRIP